MITTGNDELLTKEKLVIPLKRICKLIGKKADQLFTRVIKAELIYVSMAAVIKETLTALNHIDGLRSNGKY